MVLSKTGRKILKRLRQRYGHGKGVKILNKGTKNEHYYLNCPFHQERTASFHVTPWLGAYYCFGCHARGDIYKLAKKHPELLGRPSPPPAELHTVLSSEDMDDEIPF